MKCPLCGLINPDTAQRCDCGYDFQKGTVEKSYLTHAEKGSVGIGGWLLLVCLGLTVFSPLMTITTLGSTYQEVSPIFGQFPGLRTITILVFILSAGVTCFGIYAGATLWQKTPGTVRTAKRYLVVLLLYTVVVSILPFMAGLPSQVNKAMITEIFKYGFYAFLNFAI